MKAKKKLSFTLVELLIVIAIIIILISLVNPSLERTATLARRVVCMNEQRQVSQVSLIIADDQNGILPKGERDGWNLDHTIYIHTETYAQFLDYGLREQSLVCPNITALTWGIGVNNFEQEDENYVYNEVGTGVLIWNQYMGNRPYLKSFYDETIALRSYKIPLNTNEDPDSTLIAEGNISGSAFGQSYVMAPHEITQGIKFTGVGPMFTPAEIGGEGGNVGTLDGAVKWKDISEMNVYYNCTVSPYQGWW